MNFPLKQILIILSLCLASYNLKGFEPDSLAIYALRDSISHELQKASTNQKSLKNVLVSISKNRRILKDLYKPLMEDYIDHTGRVNFKPGLMEALDRLGHRERQEGNYNKAIELHLKSLAIATELADSNQIVHNYSNLGQAYRRQDYNTLALQYFHKAIKIQQAVGDLVGIYYSQNSIGATYFAQEEYQKAKHYIENAVNASKQHNDKQSLSYNYGCLGEIHLAQGMIDSAINYFLLSKQLKIETKQIDGIATAYHLMGKAYFAKGEFEESRKAFLSALSIHTETNNKRYEALCLAYLGKIDLHNGNVKSAEKMLNQAKDIALSIHSIENLIIIEEALSEYHKKRNNYGEAFNAITKSFAYRDSIVSTKAKVNVQALEIEYQTRNKEHEIDLLSKENIFKTQRIRMAIILILLLFTILGLISVLHLQRQRNAKVLQIDLQHKLSRSQMNPHFVSNAMSSIQYFMYNNKPDEAAKYLSKFARLNRAVLEHSLVDSIPLDDEVAMLTNYLEFEQLRLNNAFSFTVNLDENLDAEMLCIPPLFIQPFVENAVKHGVKDMEGMGIITVNFTDYKKHLKIEVIDNGPGIQNVNTAEKSKHRSRSTEIVKKRLKLLKGKYKDIPSITIANNGTIIEKKTLVSIYLPILSC